MAYCTTDHVKYQGQVAYTQLRYLTTTALLDDYINGTLIPQAEHIVDTYVGRRDGTLRHFNPHTHITTGISLDGSGKRILFIPPKYCPPIDIGTVNINGVKVFARTATNTAIKLYHQHIMYEGGRFSEGLLNVELLGTYGYTYVPEDVEYITTQICANVLLDMVRRYSADDVAATAPGMTDFSTMFGSPAIFSSPTIFTKDMKNSLLDYKIRWMDIG